MALLGALFIAFDPFYLAHSRVAHGDAPVAVFMSLSALTFFIYGEKIIGVAARPETLRPRSSRKVAGTTAPAGTSTGLRTVR